MLFCSLAMEGVGFTATLKMSGMPFVIPPSIPPQLLVTVSIFPSFKQNSSLFSLPVSAAASNPFPNSMPFMAGIPNTICDILFSIPSNMGSPTPAGSPVTVHSITPPTESPSAFFKAIKSFMDSPCSSDITGNSFAATSARASSGHRGLTEVSFIPPIEAICEYTFMPFSSRSWRAMPPAMHRGAVSLPEKCPPPV